MHLYWPEDIIFLMRPRTPPTFRHALLPYSGYRVAGGGGLLQTGLLLRKDLTDHDALGALLCLFWMMKRNWGEKL